MTGGKWAFAMGIGVVFLLIMPLVHSYTPEFYYQSEQFNVSYNIEEVIDSAKDMGYGIRVEVEPLVCRDENWTLDESGNCEGGIPVSGPVYEYINVNVSYSYEHSYEQSDKKLGSNLHGGIGLSSSHDTFEFGAAPVDPSKNLNVWHILITPRNESFNLEEAKTIILGELNQLKILKDDSSLTFEELPYSQSVLHSDGYSNDLQNSYPYIIAVVVIIIIVGSGVALYKRG